MKITIPHIFYTIEVKDTKNPPKDIKEFLDKGFIACIAKGKNRSRLYIKHPIRNSDIPTLCHELIHILQHICKERDILFTNEEEHCAYMFQYMLNEILGYEYK